MSGPDEVVYCGIGDDLDHERSLLADWGVADRLRLREADPGDRGPDALVAALRGASAAVVENVDLTADVLAALPGLRLVAFQGIGCNGVDLAAAARLGVQVANAPGFCVDEVAAHTVGMVLDLTRRITFFDRRVRAGEWDPLPPGEPLPRGPRGLRVGLVFFGAIPRAAAPALAALGMQVAAYAPTVPDDVLARHGVERYVTLDDLLRGSDVVSLHAPLTGATRHLVGERELSLMRPDAVLVNTSRGAVVDESALVAALAAGRIAGAAVDVIEDEAGAATGLRGLPTVVMTPHSAFLSEASYLRARGMALESVVDVLVHGRRPRYPVAAPTGCAG